MNAQQFDKLLVWTLIIPLLIATLILSGCTASAPLLDTQDQSFGTKYIHTNTTYYYSVDCEHNVICYYYYGSAASLSCTNVDSRSIALECGRLG